MNPNGAMDELDVLRRRNPYVRERGRYQEAPLDPRAERELEALIAGGTASRPLLDRAARRLDHPSPWVLAAVTVPMTLVLACAVALAALIAEPAGTGGVDGAHVTTRGGQGGPAERDIGGGAAVLVLHQMATGAAERPPLAPGEDQFAYLRLLIATNNGPLGQRAEAGTVHQREVWLAQRPGADGLIVEEGDAYPITSASGTSSRGVPMDTYTGIAGLPADPAALLGVLKNSAAAQGYDDLDYGAFTQAGDWLATGMAPPRVVATLYRAAALIPGVVLVPDAVDAAGRRGTGLAYDDSRSGLRYEWVVEQSTSTYLGANTYLLGDTTAGPSGLRTNTSAVLARGVAQSAGAPPSQFAPVP